MRSLLYKSLLYGAVAILAGALLLPIIVVLISSFGNAQYLQFPPQGFSIQWYERFLDDDSWRLAIFQSFKIAALSCIIATATGFCAAYGLVRGKFRFKRTVLALLILPLAVPNVISAISIYYVSAPMLLVGNTLWLSVCHATMSIPLVLLILLSSMQGIDLNLERAALSMGASVGRTIWKVVVPLMAPGIISSMLFSFLASFDELIISLFLTGVGTETLPVKVWNSLLLQIEPTIAAVSAFFVAVTLIVLIVDWAVKHLRTPSVVSG